MDLTKMKEIIYKIAASACAGVPCGFFIKKFYKNKYLKISILIPSNLFFQVV
jgi:hypothetical protein